MDVELHFKQSYDKTLGVWTNDPASFVVTAVIKAVPRSWRPAWVSIPIRSDFLAKVCDVVGLYVAPPERAIVLCVDEKSRRIATRYDKLAATFLAFVKLASIMLWLK